MSILTFLSPPSFHSCAEHAQTPLTQAQLTLSQKVTGECGYSFPGRNSDVSVKGLILSADHPRQLMFFRKHVSRRAAGKGRAVLEGVGLDAPTIAACFSAHPQKEEAVQEGLTRWCGGKGFQPPTWEVLVDAMDYAEIAQQDIQSLKTALDLHEGTYVR